MAHADPPKPTSPSKYNRRLYSFAEESPARNAPEVSREFEIIDAHLPRRDYQNLTNLNSLSIVESYRRASEAGDSHYQLSDSTAYFNSHDLHARNQQDKTIRDYSKFTRSPPAPTPTLPTDRKPTETIKY